MPYHLLIDADDTLWENNIYFERAIHNFIEFLNHSTLSPTEVRTVLNEIEKTAGYGTANFTASLIETYHRLAEKGSTSEDIQYIRQLGEQILSHPLELIEGVTETLTYLISRHDLVLLTKGDRDEQLIKVERSGVEQFFKRVVVVDEKNVKTYHHITEEMQLGPRSTWMIGNSPRSDINPALAAGLNAVYIPHPHTWILEHEEVDPANDGRLLTLARFADLRNHF